MARRHELGRRRGRGGGLRVPLPLPILRALEEVEHQLLPRQRPVAQGDDIVVQPADVGLPAQDPLVAECDELAVVHGATGSGVAGREQYKGNRVRRNRETQAVIFWRTSGTSTK